MNHVDPLARKAMGEYAFLCGGLAGAPGICERFARDLMTIAPANFHVQEPPVFPPYLPPYTAQKASFVGGCLTANLVFQTQSFVSKFEYDERGPSYVQRKFS